LQEPTVLASRIFEAAEPLLKREATGTLFRLIGVGITNLTQADAAHEQDTLDSRVASRAKTELAIDKLREKFGRNAVERGLALRNEN
jgi:DNA polymerase-4